MIKGVKKVIEQEEKVPVKVFCDICGKEIEAEESKWGLPNRPPRWVTKTVMEVTTGHHDWGNDSCDSISRYICCDAQCVQQKVNEMYDIWKAHTERGIYNDYFTNYLEIHPRQISLYPTRYDEETDGELETFYDDRWD